jgi:hypothetical protein
MNTQRPTPHTCNTLIAETHWESKWITAEGTFDPSYERTTEALRRWIDGMEQALIANAGRTRQGALATR